MSCNPDNNFALLHHPMFCVPIFADQSKARSRQIPDKYKYKIFQTNQNESQPNDHKRIGINLEIGLGQEDVCCEILMIRTWDRQLQTCRQHNSNSNKTSCYHKAHYSKDNFWVLGATFDVFKVHFKPFKAI